MPQGQTVDAEYYVKDILEKEVKPLLKRSKRTNEAKQNKKKFSKCYGFFFFFGHPVH